MNMATRTNRNDLKTIQLKRRNATRVELVKDRMGAAYLLHPENREAKWGWRIER